MFFQERTIKIEHETKKALLEQSLSKFKNSTDNSQTKKLDLSDDFAMFFDGPLTAEEQELIHQLKQREQHKARQDKFELALNDSSDDDLERMQQNNDPDLDLLMK